MRRSFTLFSIVSHAVVIAAALVAQALAVGALPTPHQPILYDASTVMPVDTQLPKPPRRLAPAGESQPRASLNAAPLAPPTGVIPETGREGERTSVPGVIDGASSGLSGAIEGLGIGTTVPPAVPLPVEPIHLHSGIKPPRKINDVPIAYPSAARSSHVHGVVILEAVIDAQGGVASVRVLRSIPLLDQSAVDVVKQWRFTPALLNNEPVPVVMTVTVNFTLQDR